MIAYYDYVGNIDIYLNVLNAIIGKERESMIDIGCCTAPNTPNLRFKSRKYIDAIDRKLDHPDEQQYFKHINFINYVPTQKYSVAFALDVIEHLPVGVGYKLLADMERFADKQILFTPLTDLFGMAKPGDDDPEAHRSLWSPAMVEGYACLVFPNYHKSWNGGAFFMFKTQNTKYDFHVIKQKLADYAIYERSI